jgi:hypothetical protein
MVDVPRCFLSNAEMPRQLTRANAILAVRDQPDRQHPLIESERGLLENSSALERKLLAGMMGVAFPQLGACQALHLVSQVYNYPNKSRTGIPACLIFGNEER